MLKNSFGDCSFSLDMPYINVKKAQQYLDIQKAALERSITVDSESNRFKHENESSQHQHNSNTMR